MLLDVHNSVVHAPGTDSGDVTSVAQRGTIVSTNCRQFTGGHFSSILRAAEITWFFRDCVLCSVLARVWPFRAIHVGIERAQGGAITGHKAG